MLVLSRLQNRMGGGGGGDKQHKGWLLSPLRNRGNNVKNKALVAAVHVTKMGQTMKKLIFVFVTQLEQTDPFV